MLRSSSRVSYVLSDSKFVKIPLSCVSGFIQGISTVNTEEDFLCVLSVNVYGDMATIEYCSAVQVEV